MVIFYNRHTPSGAPKGYVCFFLGGVLPWISRSPAPRAWMILAGQVVCTFGGAILASLLLAECVSHVSQGERSTVVGVYQAVYGLGMTIGPMLFGRWMDSGSPVSRRGRCGHCRDAEGAENQPHFH